MWPDVRFTGVNAATAWPRTVDSTSSVTVHAVVAVTMRNSRPLLVNCRVALFSVLPPTRRAAVMSSPPPSATSGVGVRGWATDHSFLSAADGVTSGGVAGRTTGGGAGTRGADCGGVAAAPTTSACGCGSSRSRPARRSSSISASVRSTASSKNLTKTDGIRSHLSMPGQRPGILDTRGQFTDRGRLAPRDDPPVCGGGSRMPDGDVVDGQREHKPRPPGAGGPVIGQAVPGEALGHRGGEQVFHVSTAVTVATRGAVQPLDFT